MNRKALFLSVFLTVFTLGIIGGVVKAMLSLQSHALVSQQEAAAAPVVYVQPTPFQPAAPVDIPAPTVISADQAAEFGLAAAGAGESLAGVPEIVNFNGVTAYEVRMQDGNMVYLSALDGTLLYNSITGSEKPVVSPDQALLIAINYLQYDQVVSIALKTYNNQPAYLIRFWNGANVYESLSGEIVAIEYIQYASGNSSNPTSSETSSGGSSGGSSENEHDDDEEDD